MQGLTLPLSNEVAMKTMLRWWLVGAVAVLAACGGGEEANVGTGHYASGVLNGLRAGNSVLISSGPQSVTLNADGTYRFGRFPTGTVYNVTATSASDTQVCSVTNGSGQIGEADIDNIVVDCADTFRIGGTLTGYTAGSGPLQLTLNGGDPLSLSADGSFHFGSRLVSGANYNVALAAVPETLVCSLTNGSGLVASADISSVAVDCTPALAGVSFTVTGLVTPDSVTVQLNGSAVDALPARTRRVTSAANGSYSFDLSVPVGSSYDVVIAGQAVGNTCTVTNGSGTLGSSGASNVLVTCSPNRYPVSGTVEFSPFDFVRLRLNGAEELLVNVTQTTQVSTEVLPFQFLTTVPYGGSYLIEVIETPAFYIVCTVANGSGTMPAGAVTNVVVVCQNFG